MSPELAPHPSGGGSPLRRFVLLLALGAWAAAAAAQGVVLQGTVRERRSLSPLAGAEVLIQGQGGAETYRVVTGSDGRWSCPLGTSGVVRNGLPPTQLSLFPNYPNPFNPSTIIPFTVSASGRLRVAVYTILGQELDSRESDVSPGSYSIVWRTKGAAGTLFYSVSMGEFRQTRRMVQLDGGGSGGLGSIHAAGARPATSLQRTSGDALYRITASSLVCEAESTDVAVGASMNIDFLLSTIHDRAFVIDLHNDVMEKVSAGNYQLADRHGYNHTDIPRLRDGGLDAQLISVWFDPKDTARNYQKALTIMNAYQAQVTANPADLGIALNAAGIEGENAAGRIATPLLLEGGYAIQNSLDSLRDLYARGIRVMTITWNASTSWAVAAADQRSTTVGLSAFGREVIRTMDSLGMIIDIAHTGIKTIEDILAITKNPIIDSHCGARALCNNSRNLSDAQIRAIAARGGVVGVVFYPPFLVASGGASIATVISHIDYIKNLVGVDYIALGSDFDGIERVVTGLEDVSRFPALTDALLRHGYTRGEVRKILGENFLRVFRAVCK